MELKGGILEVLLISAKDLKNRHILGNGDASVVVQYGEQIQQSKAVRVKSKQAKWNEKFEFKVPCSVGGKTNQLLLRIMDDFVGESSIHLEGILTEGNEKGSIEMKPSPYNVVLKDLRYHGVITVGLKFTTHANTGFVDGVFRTPEPSFKMVSEEKEDEAKFRKAHLGQRRFCIRNLMNLWYSIPWRKLYLFKGRSSPYTIPPGTAIKESLNKVEADEQLLQS